MGTAGYITRKSMLYKTGVEYGDYAMNHVQGCAHGCRYPCYAYLQKKRVGIVKNYDEWCRPVLVSNTMELLDKEIPRLKGKVHSVQLCFSTDPFMYGYPEVQEMSMAAIKKLNDNDIKCVILTKGILPEELKAYSLENEYGITLISLNEEYRKQMEPGAAPYKERLDALRILHEEGCRTWISMEPYPTPNMLRQNLHELLQNVAFVDKIVFGKTNYNRMASAWEGNREFYNACAEEVMSFCREHQIQCHIKEKTITV